MSRTRTFVASVAVVAALLMGCGGGSRPTVDDSVTADREPLTETTEATGTADATATTTDAPTQQPAARVARTDRALVVFAAPDAPEAVHELPATTEFGSPRALLVLEEQGEWLQVSLPVRPNGSTGWIRRDSVDVVEVPQSIEVDLERRTLTLVQDGVVVVDTAVAIGAADAPTPTGLFFVTDKLDTGDDSSPYGRFAMGLSAHSDVFSEFAGGDGQIGIHGTNDPSSIGRAVSHGCIRVPNDVAVQLNELLRLGAPVFVH